MRTKAKLISALTAGIITVMSFAGVLPHAVNSADAKIKTDAAAEYEAPAIVLGSAEGAPGETVRIPVNVYCGNSLSSFDTTIGWNDETLVSSLAYMGNAKNIGGIVSDKYDDCCLIMLSSKEGAPVSDGMVAYIDYTIPKSAVSGTVYELYFDAVDEFRSADGSDLRDALKTYSGTITVTDGSAAVTTDVTTENTTAVSVTSATTVSSVSDVTVTSAVTTPPAETIPISTSKEYDEGCLLMLSAGKGKPGEKVTIDFMELCVNDLEAADVVIGWSDPALKLTTVYGEEINGGIDSIQSDNLCSFMAVGEHITDGIIGRLEFTIPGNAVPGTVYDIYFDSVNTFYSSDGTEHANRTKIQNGRINVTDKAGNIVTTAAPKQDSTTSTTVSGYSGVSSGSASLALSKTKLDLIVGDSLHLKVSGNRGTVKWSSSDSDTVTVNSKGAVNAVRKGSALVIAYVDGTYLTCEVNVEPDDPTSSYLLGDANEDGKVNVRDAAHIAKCLAQGRNSSLPSSADFNEDGKVNVRDAAAIAKHLATGKK